MALPHHAYRDPLEQMLRAESFTCRGCIQRVRNELFGTIVFTCRPKMADGTPRKEGRRCNQFEEQE